MALPRSSALSLFLFLFISAVTPAHSSPDYSRAVPNATTFVVNSTSDMGDANPGDGVCDAGGGVCTLRAAIMEANALAGADVIQFAIGGGAQTINITSSTPWISDTVTIDATTQPGYSGVPLIEIDGSGSGGGGGDGLTIAPGAPGCTIRGLMINRFPGSGISIGSDNNLVESCIIGTEATGTQNRGNAGEGIRVSAASHNVIRLNVVAFNGMNGVAVFDGDNFSFPFFTALTPDQTAIFPSIDFNDNCSNFQHTSSPAPIVDTSGRGFDENFGMRLTATMSIAMPGNYNFDLAQLDDLGRLVIDSVEWLNVNGGSVVRSVPVNLSAGDHTIEVDFWEGGGAARILMNVSGPSTPAFTFNSNPGFQGELFQGRIPAEQNTISQNSTYDNNLQGIALGCCCRDVNDDGDIDVGPNTFLNYPIFTNHLNNPNGTITAEGTATPGTVVEVFASTNDAAPPGQGYGEGKLYLASTPIVGAGGTFSATFNLPSQYYSVTATATDGAGNTSEFSQNTFVLTHPITVTNQNDSGPGSLRDAINEANSDGVDSLITFDPSLSGSAIVINSPLPALTENSTTINGDINGDCKPDIELQGNGGAPNGLTILSATNSIRGLALNRFGPDVVAIDGAPASSNELLCNFIGTDLSGTISYNSGPQGLVIRNGASANRIGQGGRNVIGAFGIDSVLIANGPNNIVAGNTIGLDVTGNVPMASPIGVQITSSNSTQLGLNLQGNRIAAINGSVDVQASSFITIHGNTIGWPAGSTPPLGYGIRVSGGSTQATIGATMPGFGNRIENNGGSGIRLEGNDTDFISIRGNSISGNGALGIDLDGNGVTPNDGGADADNGANDDLNFPVLTRATTNGSTTAVDGFLDTTPGSYDVEFYASSERDPSGYGEGATLVHWQTIAPGAFSVNLPPVPIGSYVTATATGSGNTSEFSLAIAVTGPPLGATDLVAYPLAPSSIELRWRDPNASETGFRIERMFGGGGFGFLTNVGPDTTTYLDTTIPPGATAWYRVIATSSLGDAPPSNIAMATSFTSAALTVCRTKLNGQHQSAGSVSAAYNGTNWTIAWQDQRNGRESDIFFQLLNAADGAPIGVPVQVTNDDVPSRLPTLVWNGTNFGLLWYDHRRQPDGGVKSRFSFAILDAVGNKVRGDLRIGSATTAGPLNPDGQSVLVWDGGGWGIFLNEAVSSPADLVFYRLDANGNVVVNALPLTQTPALEGSVSAAWSGSEYGIAWVEQTDPGGFHVKFQRMQPNGSFIGPRMNLWDNGAPGTFDTNLIWDGSGWALTWTDSMPSGDTAIFLMLLNPDGTQRSAPARISDDGAVFDQSPKLFVRPGGGYVIYTQSIADSGAAEVGRLEADANGARVGSRTLISPHDGFDSGFERAAASGSSFLVAWEDSATNDSEVNAAVVSPAGVTGTINQVTSTHTPPSFAASPTVVALPQNGFVTLWSEAFHGANQIHAKIFRGDGTFVDRRPLNGGNVVRRPVAVANGNSFAVAWTDANTSGLHFDRFDGDGNSQLGGGVMVASPVNIGRGAGLASNGDIWGLVWVQGGQLRFQQMGPIAPIGSPTTISPISSPDPQIQWIGSGWALLWRSNQNLMFARLDPSGALIVPPMQVTDTFANPNDFQLLWSGRDLGVVYSENHDGVNPGTDIYFTVLDLNGFKKFAPVAVASTQFTDRLPSMYFDGANFRILYPDYTGGIRDIGVTPAGTLAPGTRFFGNHGEGRISSAYNGATTAMAWQHFSDILFQTSGCTADASPPVCVALAGSFNNGAVQLNWPPANDPQSGILSYNLYRDGNLLMELLPSTTSYSDGGFTPAAVHVYQLRPFNGAYLEAAGCNPLSITAGILLTPATLPNARQGANYNQTIVASQGTAPYSFAVTNGALPTGLSLNSGNGLISGPPANAGTSTFTITATDSAAKTGSRTYTLRVCPPAFIVPTVLPDPIVNAAYSQVISLRGTTDTFTAAVTGGALPAGLTLASDGTLSGSPTVTGPANFTVTLTESSGCASSQPYAFNVGAGTAPRDVRAEAQSSSSILVKWERPQRGETGFRVERSTDAINWGSIDIVGADVISYLDQGLSPATLYYYRVVSFSGAFDFATSNVAAAMTFPFAATKICQQPIGPYHARAQALSLAHDGTKWAAVWNDRSGGQLEDIFFQFLDNNTGAPVGSPVRVTQTDMLTRFPMVRWNGSRFGVLYAEQLRSPAGDATSTTNFALLDGSGNLLRTGVRVFNTMTGAINGGLDLPFVWDGSGWGVFESAGRDNPPADLYYWRLGPTGDVVAGPVRLTNTTAWNVDISAFWNGTEYGLAWIEFKDGNSKLNFQRMQINGTLIGSPVVLDQSSVGTGVSVPNLTWNGTEWALAWDVANSDETFIRFVRLNSDGSPKAAPVRLSDDTFVDDELPQVMPKSGGGYHVFVLSNVNPNGTYDVARLEAGASGNRVGTSTVLTPLDALGSNVLRVATDGSRFMLGYDDISATQVEAGNIIVNSAGALTNGPTAVTTGHGDGGSVSPAIVPVAAGFAAIWNENGATPQLRAKIYDGGGNLTSTNTPLSPSTGVRSRVAAVGVGSTFAVVWRDTSAIRFGRFDGAGNPLIPETVMPTGGNQPGLAWNGEHYAVVFNEGGNLRFQKINPDGTQNGPRIFVGSTAGNAPQILWAGSGWAIVWRQGTDLYFALLDRNGAAIVPAVQFTFTASPENNYQIAWSGDRLGVVWSEDPGPDPPGADIWFTALKLDGTKAFTEENVASTPYSDGQPSTYWDHDRFRIVYSNGLSSVRELAVQSDGTIVPGERLYFNRNAAMSIAFNGTTLGMLFNGLFDLTIQTNACFDDATAPPCPNPGTSFDGQKVHLTWPAVGDPESGILAYNVYRDGGHLAELSGATLQYDDKGFVSGAAHVYEVRAVNRAYRESSGCTTRTVIAGISINPPTLANSNVGVNYLQTLSGTQGTGPYTFAVTAGALPPGLSLNGTSGAIAGVPTSAGSYAFTVTATDSLAQTGSRAYTIRICSNITLFPTLLSDGFLGTFYSQTLVTSGAVGAVTYAIPTGTLPAGVTMDATGWINGVPTALGTFNITITTTDSIGCTASRAYSIAIQSGAAVRNLSAFTTGTSTIRLRWSDPQRNETGFRLERSLDLGATWSPFAIVGPDTTTYTDVNLSAATPYSYRVIATTPGGDAPASNVASANTFPTAAAKVCVQQVSPQHAFARSGSVAYTGTQWAMAYSDRKNGENDEIYFTFLDATGAPAGAPLRVTNNDMNSIRPMLRWNGSKFGVMWLEILRGPSGEPINQYRFALIDGAGNIVRNDANLSMPDEIALTANDIQFFWDGSAWGFFDTRLTSDGFVDLFFFRFDEDGDLLAGPLRITTNADADFQPAIAWNGTEYGVTWARWRDTMSSILFQRVSSAGAPIGSPAVLAGPTSSPMQSDIAAVSPSGWAVVWTESPDGVSDAVSMRRVDAAGVPIGPSTRLSDDYDLNGFTAPDQVPVSDIFPEVYALPGGGFAVFTRASLNATGRQEVGYLRADAAGVRLGTRTIISTQDGFNSGFTRTAFDSTNFLAVYNEHRLGTQEIASVIVNQSGVGVAGPTDLTTGHSPGNSITFNSSGNPQVVAIGAGFAALWSEPVSAVENRVFAKLYDGNGAVIATKSPLSTRSTRARPAAVAVGSTFATAWKDAANNIVFGRWDASGNALITETNVTTNAGGPANMAIGFDGENYGLLWNQGGRLNFQRVTPGGTLVGSRSTLPPQIANVPQQMIWTGSGWAIVFVTDSDVYYALLDINGAVIVAPIRVTFTPADNKEGLAIAWSGDAIGIAYASRPPLDPPGLIVNFTTVDLDGIKQFNELAINEGRFDTTVQGLNWNADHFRLAYVPGEGGTLRELDFSPNGAVLGASRMLANRGGPASVVWNGATEAILWVQIAELYFETTACLADTTPPSCPDASAVRSGNAVNVTWQAATDPQTPIYRYEIFRDGRLIADTPPNATSYTDAGASLIVSQTYRVAAVNGAFLESTGCPTQQVLGIPSQLVATASSETQVQVEWMGVTGASEYNVERSTDGTTYTPAGTTATTSWNDATVQAAHSYLYRVRAVQGLSTSGPSNIDIATTILFTDDPFVPPQPMTKAVHLAELRQAADAVRALAGMGAGTWTDAAIAGTRIRAVHIDELRASLNAARTAVGLTAVTFTDTISAGTAVKPAHFQEVRDAVK